MSTDPTQTFESHRIRLNGPSRGHANCSFASAGSRDFPEQDITPGVELGEDPREAYSQAWRDMRQRTTVEMTTLGV